MSEEVFIEELKKINLNLTEEQLIKFKQYSELLKEYNKKFNLTTIIEDNQIYLKHFYDSLCIFKSNKLQDNISILDIGTGAGFPGIPISIISNKINVTLVESNNKKCIFLNKVKSELELNNITIVNERAEIFSKKNREKFDIVTSRAVSHLKILLELEVPALKVHGYFIPLKSNIDVEINESQFLLKELDCEIENIIEYKLPIENSNRTLILIQKKNITSNKYPREYNKIIKSK